jgi:hypothetical protein
MRGSILPKDVHCIPFKSSRSVGVLLREIIFCNYEKYNINEPKTNRNNY